jgi:hypothetical protein
LQQNIEQNIFWNYLFDRTTTVGSFPKKKASRRKEHFWSNLDWVHFLVETPVSNVSIFSLLRKNFAKINVSFITFQYSTILTHSSKQNALAEVRTFTKNIE